MVGVDGSPQSALALRWAARIAATTGAMIDAVIAWHFPAGYGWSGVTQDWHPDQEAQRALAETIAQTFGTAPPATIR